MPSSSNSTRPCAGGKSQQPQGIESTMSSGSSKDNASTSPPTRGSRSGFSVSASNGITPMMANIAAEPPQAGTSASAVQIPNHLKLSSPIWGRFQELKQPSGSSKNKAPVPLPSRRMDMKPAQGLSLPSAVPLLRDHSRYPEKPPNLLRRFRRPKRHNTDPLPSKPLAEKEPFPPPPASINTVLTAFPPQDPTFSLSHPKAKRKMGASHTSGEVSAGLASSGAHDVSGAHGKGRRGRKRSDPHPVGSKLSSGSSKGKASTSPQATRSSRSQRFLVPAQNGITPTATNNSAEPLPLRRSARNVISPKPTAAVPSLENLDQALRRSVDFVFLKIQDFGYAENDPRRQYDLTINLHDPPRPPSPAPPGFIPPMNMDETEESGASSDSEFIAGQTPRAGDGGGGWLSKDPFNAEDYDHQLPSQFDLDPIDFTPGVYRALYPYDPERSAEMALKEDQEVTCLGRGEGEGWLVVVKEVTRTGEVVHALVPEGHMQLIRPLEE